MMSSEFKNRLPSENEPNNRIGSRLDVLKNVVVENYLPAVDEIDALYCDRVSQSAVTDEGMKLFFQNNHYVLDKIYSECINSFPSYDKYTSATEEFQEWAESSRNVKNQLQSEIISSGRGDNLARISIRMGELTLMRREELKARYRDRAREELKGLLKPDGDYATVRAHAETSRDRCRDEWQSNFDPTLEFVTSEVQKNSEEINELDTKQRSTFMGRIALMRNEISLKRGFFSSDETRQYIEKLEYQLSNLLNALKEKIESYPSFMNGRRIDVQLCNTLRDAANDITAGLLEDYKTDMNSEAFLSQLRDHIESTLIAEGLIRPTANNNHSTQSTPAEKVSTSFDPRIKNVVDTDVQNLKSEGLDTKEIKKKLNRKYHPDVNPDDKDAMDKMKYFSTVDVGEI